MQKTLPELRLRATILLAALVLAGCSNSRSLLVLENEKTDFRTALAQKIGAPRAEVEQALVGTPEQERRTAEAITEDMTARVGQSSDVAMTAYLQQMARRLARSVKADHLPIQVVLLKSNRANAFTPGAGTILVNEGLLQITDNEAQMAAVMAHEMAHIILKHPQRQKLIRLAGKVGRHIMDDYTPDRLANNLGRVLRLGGNATLNGMIRQQELMADSIGIDILVKAGYDPHEMTNLLHKLAAMSPQRDRTVNIVYGNHPLTADREIAARMKVTKQYHGNAGVVSSPRFDALIEAYHQRPVKRLASSAQ
jgi:beta-barrel assembly-enhancing protease